jgi:hypothetical protein
MLLFARSVTQALENILINFINSDLQVDPALKRFTWTFVLALLAVSPLAASDAAKSPAEPDAAAFERALQDAREDASLPFGLEVACRDEARHRAARVYPGGAGAWDNSMQIRVDEAVRNGLIDDLLGAGFARFEPRYGGQDKPSKAEAAMRILCQIRATAGELEKYSVQAAYGEQSAAFARLAAALLDRLEPLADGGVKVGSLEQALGMLARGELAPELLVVRLVRLPPRDDGRKSGVIARLDGLDASRQPYRPGQANGPRQPARLSAGAVTRIAEAAAAAGFVALPVNVSGAGYTELELAVLGHRKTVIARESMRAAAGEESARFERLARAILSELGSD